MTTKVHVVQRIEIPRFFAGKRAMNKHAESPTSVEQFRQRRRLVWIERATFYGFGCSCCTWIFKPVAAPAGKSLDEVAENYQTQLNREFSAHVCAELLRNTG
jgi:hypothetical protein